jgi:hypothetical protein
MKAPEHWSANDLHAHLQHAIDLEFWTIPLYLSSLYSIENLDKIERQDYPVAAKLLASVAVQEMLHLELVSNLANALGHTPSISCPHYDDVARIPFIHPDPSQLPERLRGFHIRIGPLDENQLKLFCAIEHPDSPVREPWAQKDEYDSIGEFYEALRIGVEQLWDDCFVGEEVRRWQVGVFDGYTPKTNPDIGFSQTITTRASALDAIDAIIAQGEGASNADIPPQFEPPKQTAEHEYHAGWFAPELSHYQKLSIILENIEHLPPVYPLRTGTDEGPNAAQRALESHFHDLLYQMNAAFRPGGRGLTGAFWTSMGKMEERITAVWRSGVVPSFTL